MKTCCFSSSFGLKGEIADSFLILERVVDKKNLATVIPKKWKHHYLTTGETPCSDEVQVLSLRVHEQLLNGPWADCVLWNALSSLKLHTILPRDSQQPQHLSTCWRCNPWALSCENSIITWVLSTHGQDHTHLWNPPSFDLIYTLANISTTHIFCHNDSHSQTDNLKTRTAETVAAGNYTTIFTDCVEQLQTEFNLTSFPK